MRRRLTVAYSALLVAAALAAGPAHADGGNDERLRDALRQSVMEMRAAQDQAAQAQADLAKALADKAALQTQVDADRTKLAEAPAKPVAKTADLAALQAQLRATQGSVSSLQQTNAQLRDAYQTTTGLARAKADESKQAEANLRANTAALQTCKTANAKLIDVAEQVLHLYESQGFRSVLLKSYEPIIGTERVRLENMVQDYDDKIRDQEYVAHAAPGK